MFRLSIKMGRVSVKKDVPGIPVFFAFLAPKTWKSPATSEKIPISGNLFLLKGYNK